MRALSWIGLVVIGGLGVLSCTSSGATNGNQSGSGGDAGDGSGGRSGGSGGSIPSGGRGGSPGNTAGMAGNDTPGGAAGDGTGGEPTAGGGGQGGEVTTSGGGGAGGTAGKGGAGGPGGGGAGGKAGCSPACATYQTCDVARSKCTPQYLGSFDIGAASFDNATGIAVAPDGSYFVTGGFQGSVDFDPRPNMNDNQFSGGATTSAQFVTKFSGDGTYQWTRVLTGVNYPSKVAAGADGSVYVTGGFFGGPVDLNPGSGNDPHTGSNGGDGFIVRLTGDGTFVWSDVFPSRGPGIPSSQIHDIMVAGANIFIAGDYANTADLDPGPGTDEHTSVETDFINNPDGFLMMLNSDGQRLWVQTAGGPGADSFNGLAVAANGSVWSTGIFGRSVNFGTGAKTVFNDERSDAFVLKSTGGFTDAVYTFGGAGFDFGNSIVVDASGGVYVGGAFAATVDFDPGTGVQNRTGNASSDFDQFAFLLKLDSAGRFVWVHDYGSTPGAGGLTDVSRVRLLPDGTLLFAGDSRGNTDFGTTATPDVRTIANSATYVSHMDAAGNYLGTLLIAGANTIDLSDLAANAAGFWAVGYFGFGVVDFDPGPGGDNFNPASGDVFITRYGL